ncbi:MAG: hypothetical protein LBH43_09825 [Treponema sp.]|jgi:hypothetical protein|nr:hypothetical protein [Treponema sp.]
MTNRENFFKAILRDKPERVPINGGYCDGKYDAASECKVVNARLGNEEWGYSFSRAESDTATMGQVTEHPLKCHVDIQKWQPPGLVGENQFEGISEKVKGYKDADLFVFGGVGSFVYERLHYLVGMEELFVLMYDAPELFCALGDKIVNFNCEFIREYAKTGIDGVWGGDDWGLQDRLMISPALWRTFFKPWYAKLFGTAKELGLITYMHSCGKNNEIIGDLIECGLDVIELHQPNVYDVDWLSLNAGGKLCFSTTPDIQTTLPFGDREKILCEVRNLKEKLGCFNGGLMYILYGNPEAIGASHESMEFYLDTAREVGKYS